MTRNTTTLDNVDKFINGKSGCSLLAAYWEACGSSQLALSKGQQPLGAVMHSSRELSETRQW